jgi:hypothetical protein
MRSRLRRASERGLRGAVCEFFRTISKFLQPETISDYLLIRRLFPF